MINFHFVNHLIKHYWSATRIDVLHSPFVYNLYTNCLAPAKTPAELLTINKFWQQVIKNKQVITQHDFGASGVKKSVKNKTISWYATHYASPKKVAQIIYRLIKYQQLKHGLELGTSLAYTTMHIAQALPKNGSLITIEGSPDTSNQALKHLTEANLASKVKLITGHFDDELPAILFNTTTLDFAFIDGNHTYEATMRYFNWLLPKMHNNAMLVFDDIYWSKGMTKAWNEIKANKQVMVTIDLFFIGLVFFRKEQAKEHFKLRIW